MARQHLKQRVWDKSGGKCWYCGMQLRFRQSGLPVGQFLPDLMAIDHLVPECQGGDGASENLVPCCKSCNSTKGTGTLERMRDCMTFRSVGSPFFHEGQMGWLRANGVDIFAGRSYRFWFETNADQLIAA